MSNSKVHRVAAQDGEDGLEAHLVSSLLTNLAEATVLEPADYHIRKGERDGFVEVMLDPKLNDPKVHYVLLTIAPEETSERHDGPARAMEGLRIIVAKAVKAAVKDLGPSSPSSDPAIQRLMDVIVRALPKARRMASETTIEKMVDALVETQDPVAQVSASIDADNAHARLRFMNEIPTLTAEEIAGGIASTARNRHQTASRWKKDGKIFSVNWQGLERYPHFQFKEGRPLPIIADVLRILPGRMSPWETAFWFVSTNGWLDGAAPCDRLAEPERIAEAAGHEGEVIAG